MKILGINGWIDRSHDASACLIIDGKIISAVEEERFVRQKKAYDRLPINSVKFCLQENKLTLDDIDYVSFGWNWKKLYELRGKRYTFNSAEIIEKFFPRKYFKYKKIPKLHFIEHHLAHASSTFRCSGFNDSAILVVDGQGESCSTSIWKGKNNEIKKVWEDTIGNSLGYFYTAVTKYVGMKDGDEGKLMGLATYGSPDEKIIDKLNDFKVKIPREEFRCNLDEQDFVVNRWLRFLEGEFGPINAPNTYFKKENGTILKNLDFDSCQKNIAASAQKLLELKMIDLVRFALKKTNCKNICLSGGVALNCIANKEILKNNDIDNLFIQPASNDAGVSMGAALESFCRKGGKLNFKLNRSDFGPEFTNLEIKKELDLMNLSYKKVSNISKECAELIKDGKIIGWFQGRMEWGPRALGNRSIIANPTSMAMANKVNLNVKNRELWRPFAPSLLSEFSKDYLKIESDYDFMVLGSEIYPEMKKRIKGVVHLDGSIRPHVVKKSVNPKYHKLITEFYNLTGIPLVLNTSFNVRGEPIVCTPKEAVKTFFSTGLDCLAMGDYLIKK
jgi:carbamoyltransferase